MGIYRDGHEEEYQVVVRRARSREEMRPTAAPRTETAPERVPWAERALEQETARLEDGG